MNVTASIKLCANGGPLKAPERFRIWRAGSNPGDYGALSFTPAAAAAVMAAYEARGVAMVIDIEHGLNPSRNLDPSKPVTTGGYLALELVNGELWGVPRWSDCGRAHAEPEVVCCAKHQIETGQRIYVSPDWDMDAQTREPMRLNRVGLVAEPGTWGIPMLASASAKTKVKATMDEKMLRAAYATAQMQAGAAEGPLKDAATAYVEQLKAAAGAMGVDLEKEPEAAPASEKAPVTAASDAPAPADKPAEPVNASASRGVTMADVQRLMAEKAERDAMLADDRLSTDMRNVVASADLKTARAIVKALPAKPAPTHVTTDVNHVASATPAEVPMTEAERFTAERLRGALGQSTENVAAARKLMASDPEGAVSVSLGSLVEKHKKLRNPASSAMRFGV